MFKAGFCQPKNLLRATEIDISLLISMCLSICLTTYQVGEGRYENLVGV